MATSATGCSAAVETNPQSGGPQTRWTAGRNPHPAATLTATADAAGDESRDTGGHETERPPETARNHGTSTGCDEDRSEHRDGLGVGYRDEERVGGADVRAGDQSEVAGARAAPAPMRHRRHRRR